jgi:hypothetical protein
MVTTNNGLNGITQIAQQMSGSRTSLPKPSPLRTGRDDCSSSGSSLCRLVPVPHMMRMMAPSVYQLQVVQLVCSTARARFVMMLVDERYVLIEVEPQTTHRTLSVLSFQQR